jgi:hypothetical protein
LLFRLDTGALGAELLDGTKAPNRLLNPSQPGSKQMSQVDPWEKAAECARAIQCSTDPHHKAVLHNVQHMWIALGNELSLMTDEEAAREAEKIGRLHIRFSRMARH